MPALCCVPECNNKGGHLFPKDERIRKKWAQAVRPGESNWKPLSSTVVCSDHFDDRDYTKATTEGDQPQIPTLKKNAVPHIFSWGSSTPPNRNVRKTRGMKRLRSILESSKESSEAGTSREKQDDKKDKKDKDEETAIPSTSCGSSTSLKLETIPPEKIKKEAVEDDVKKVKSKSKVNTAPAPIISSTAIPSGPFLVQPKTGDMSASAPLILVPVNSIPSKKLLNPANAHSIIKALPMTGVPSVMPLNKSLKAVSTGIVGSALPRGMPVNVKGGTNVSTVTLMQTLTTSTISPSLPVNVATTKKKRTAPIFTKGKSPFVHTSKDKSTTAASAIEEKLKIATVPKQASVTTSNEAPPIVIVPNAAPVTANEGNQTESVDKAPTPSGSATKSTSKPDVSATGAACSIIVHSKTDHSDKAGVHIVLHGHTESSLCGLVFNWRTLCPDGNPITFKDYLCNFCREKYRDRTLLIEHMSTHKFTCNHCNYESFTRFGMLKHKQKAHPTHIDEIQGFEGFENTTSLETDAPVNSTKISLKGSTAVMQNTTLPENVAADSTMSTTANDVEIKPSPTPEPQVLQQSAPDDKKALSTVSVQRSTTTVSDAPKSVAQPQQAASSSSYFTYKIVHDNSGAAVAYACDVCSFQTDQLNNIYSHASTHTMDDLNKSTSGNILWECFYCDYKASLQVMVVNHVTKAHAGKPVQLKRYHRPDSVKLGRSPGSLEKVPDNSASPERGQNCVWGCYYCSVTLSTRELVVKHEMSAHPGQKLIVSKRLTKSVDQPIKHQIEPVSLVKKMEASPSSPVDNSSSKRKQIFPKRKDKDTLDIVPLDHTAITRGKRMSKYDLLVSELNKRQMEESTLQSANVRVDDDGNIDQTVAMLMDNYADDFTDSNDQAMDISDGISELNPIVEFSSEANKQVDYTQLYVHSPTKGSSKCNICSKVFFGIHALSHVKEHVTIHTGVKTWGCPYCSYKHNRRVSIVRHVSTRHKDNELKIIRLKPYKSYTPSSSTKNKEPALTGKKSGLWGPRSVRERKILASAKTLWQCPLCPRRSVFKGTIVVHMKLVHPGQFGKVDLQRWARPIDAKGCTKQRNTKARVHLFDLESLVKSKVFDYLFEGAYNPSLEDYDLDDYDEDMDEDSHSDVMFRCVECPFGGDDLLAAKSHVMTCHPDAEPAIGDFRGGAKLSKKRFFCSYPNCMFLGSMKAALTMHFKQKPSHCKDNYSDGGISGDNMHTNIESLLTASGKPSGNNPPALASVLGTVANVKTEPDSPSCGDQDETFMHLGGLDEDKQDLSVEGTPGDEPPQILGCKYCNNIATTDLKTIRDHLSLAHPNKSPIVVDIHNRRSHRGPYLLRLCPICDFLTTNSENFAQHFVLEHHEAPPVEYDQVEDDPDYEPEKQKSPVRKKRKIKFPPKKIVVPDKKTECSLPTTDTDKEITPETMSQSFACSSNIPSVIQEMALNTFPMGFLCDLCKQHFDFLEQIRQHQISEQHCHLQEGGYFCSDRKAMIQKKGRRVYLCEHPQCFHFCREKIELVTHLEECTSTNPSSELPIDYEPNRNENGDNEPTMPVIQEVSSNSAQMKELTEMVAGTEAADKMYQCSYCSCIMTNLDQMKKHLLSKHATTDRAFTQMLSSVAADGSLQINVKENQVHAGASQAESVTSSMPSTTSLPSSPIDTIDKSKTDPAPHVEENSPDDEDHSEKSGVPGVGVESGSAALTQADELADEEFYNALVDHVIKEEKMDVSPPVLGPASGQSTSDSSDTSSSSGSDDSSSSGSYETDTSDESSSESGSSYTSTSSGDETEEEDPPEVNK